MSTATEKASRADVLEAVELLEQAVSAWEVAEEPLAQFNGRTVKAISDAMITAATELFDALATPGIDREAWDLVLAVDRFEAALMNWAQRSQSKPHSTDPGGGSEVWGPYGDLLRAKTPRRMRKPTPMKSLTAQNVSFRQIAKEYGWYLADGTTPDETKVMEELSEPGLHYRPDSYVHPHDARYLAELESQWNKRCEGLSEDGSAFGAMAAANRAEAPRRQKEWKAPPEPIEELLRQNVGIVQIAKMHRVDVDEVRQIAADLGIYSDPSVYAFVRQHPHAPAEAVQQQEKAETLRINPRSEYSDIEERIVALSEDGHPPGVIARVLKANGHPEITHQRVTRVLQNWAEAEPATNEE